jgi:hypothetical protein
MEFAAVVQPVLDRHCVRCHDGSEQEHKAFDLTARATRPFMGVALPVSYYNLRAHVRHAPIHTYFLPPGSFGSRVSPVMDMLAKGHNDVELGPDEWRRLCAWIDCNAPGIGDYKVADASQRDVRAEELREQLAARRKDTVDRRRLLADALPEGERLVCYLDCGVQGADGVEGDVTIREVIGQPYLYGAGESVVEPWYDDISFDGRELVYELSGLAGNSQYMLGFSWWDHNDAGREMTVTVRPDPGGTGFQPVTLLSRTRLPAWSGKQEKPEERTAPLPRELSEAGAVQIAFTNVSDTGNAVLSEVWLTQQQ